MNAALYLLNNGMLIFFSSAVSYSEGDLFHEKLIKAAVVYFLTVLAQIIFAGLILKRMNLLSLSLASAVFFLAGIAIAFTRKITLLALFKTGGSAPRQFTWNIYLKLISAIVASTLCFKFVTSFLLIPYGGDAVLYHLPNLVDYIQSQKIFLCDKSILSNCYPKNIEMLYLWQLIHLRNGVTVNLVSYFLAVLGAMGVYGILLRQRVGREYALLGSLLYLATPIILAQMNSAYIDASLGSVFIICLYFIVRYSSAGSDENLVYLSISIGLLLGAKYSSLAFFAVFLIVLFVVLLARGKPSAAAVSRLSLVAAGSVLTGGVWYLLNYLNFNNPIYPFQFKLTGLKYLEGIDANLLESRSLPYMLKGVSTPLKILVSWTGIGSNSRAFVSAHDFLHDSLITQYDQRMGGFGLQWMFIYVPATAVMFYRRIKDKLIERSELVLAFTVIASFAVTPMNWWTRFVSFVVALGIYCFIRLQDDHVKNAGLISALVVLVLVSCVQGSLRDIMQYKYIFANYPKGETVSFRSAYVQKFDPAYRDIFKMINKGPACSIILFEPINQGFIYYYQGDHTQNTVRIFPNDKTPIATYEQFSSVLENVKPKYVLVPGEFDGYIRSYLEKHTVNPVRLNIDDGSGSVFYQLG